jgi:hypothetical protein
MKPVAWIGWALFVVLVTVNIGNYGKRWAFVGPCYLPKSLLDATGTRFRDGSELDPLTAALVRARLEEEFYAIGLLVIVGGSAYCLWRMKQYVDMERAHLQRMEEWRR